MRSEIVLCRCESIVFFVAMMLPVVVEAAVLYWIFQYQGNPTTSSLSFTSVGEWTGLALPQACLISALLMLADRAVMIFVIPAGITNRIFSRTWLSFIRLWRWTIAMIFVQELGILLGRAVAS